MDASAFDLSGLESLRLGSVGGLIGASVNEFSTDGTLSQNSNSKVPTQNAVKTYVDTTLNAYNNDKILEGDSSVEVVDAGSNGNIQFKINNGLKLQVDSDGNTIPGADNASNLGSSTKRWKNIYAADMHYSNKGDKNSVDGTWGSYTIQEGENDLFLLNNRNGKKYKFNLTEVN